jgi:Na+/phosphate symporter
MNGIAIVPFCFSGLIVWPQAILMAMGASLGSYITAQGVNLILN